MKKIIIITIFIAFLFITISPAYSWCPPGMDDDHLKDTPWSDLESVNPDDDDSDINQIQAIDCSDQELQGFMDSILLLISTAIYLNKVFEDNTAIQGCNESIY